MRDVNEKSVEIAKRFPVRRVHAVKGHLGIEKLMLDVLDYMSAHYDRSIVLEDDCFPTSGSIDAFEKTLADVKEQQDVYSVYGCHFGTEPKNERDFTRFQGWGWAAHSDKIKLVLPELRALFLLPEEEYLKHVSENITDDIRAKLDRTLERKVLNVLKLFYSWDSATAFVTARRNLRHRRTDKPVVINTGIVSDAGHFSEDRPMFRRKPFNMITLDEAWDHFDQS